MLSSCVSGSDVMHGVSRFWRFCLENLAVTWHCQATSGTNVNNNNGERRVMHWWKYSHYFDFVSMKDDNIKVRGTLCAVDKVFKNTTSNLKKHLESQHGTEKLKEKVPPGGAGAKQRATTNSGGPRPKQQKLDLKERLSLSYFFIKTCILFQEIVFLFVR